MGCSFSQIYTLLFFKLLSLRVSRSLDFEFGLRLTLELELGLQFGFSLRLGSGLGWSCFVCTLAWKYTLFFFQMIGFYSSLAGNKDRNEALPFLITRA